MVVRDEGDRLRRYGHIGTGNYHPKTARLYEDLGLLTTDEEVGEDVARLFNVLSGYSMETEYNRLLVAPHSCAPASRAHRPRGRATTATGRPRGIRIKCNSIVDEAIIDALYRASQAGVPVDVLGARHLRAAPRRPGPVGDHPGAQRPRPLPRALAASSRSPTAASREVWIGSAPT